MKSIPPTQQSNDPEPMQGEATSVPTPTPNENHAPEDSTQTRPSTPPPRDNTPAPPTTPKNNASTEEDILRSANASRRKYTGSNANGTRNNKREHPSTPAKSRRKTKSAKSASKAGTIEESPRVDNRETNGPTDEEPKEDNTFSQQSPATPRPDGPWTPAGSDMEESEDGDAENESVASMMDSPTANAKRTSLSTHLPSPTRTTKRTKAALDPTTQEALAEALMESAMEPLQAPEAPATPEAMSEDDQETDEANILATPTGAQPGPLGVDVWAEYTIDNVTRNTLDFERTAAPPGGWPTIYLGTPPTHNIPTAYLAKWDELGLNTLWVYLYRGRYEGEPGAQYRIKQKIEHAIRMLTHLDEDDDLSVAFPVQEKPSPSDDRFASPYFMLVTGLPQDRVNRLLSMKVISTEEVTFFTVPRAPQRALFIVTIVGLTYNINDRSHSAVLDIVRTTFQASAGVRAIVGGDTNSVNNPLDNVLGRIDVRGMVIKTKHGDAPVWNVFFVRAPSLSRQKQENMLAIMRACTFRSPSNTFGIGHKIADPLLCTGCKSIDHDPANCPFSRVAGWKGFTPRGRKEEHGQDPPAHRGGGGRGRGGRARGRGRGVRGRGRGADAGL